MPTVDVPWATSTSPGSAPGEGTGRLINCYAFAEGDGVRWKSSPGLDDFGSLPPGEPRGALYALGQLTEVAGSKVYQVDVNGNATPLEGSLPGSGPVTLSRNNSLTPTIVIASSNGAYVILSGVVSPYPDDNLPQVNDVAFLDGYFLFTTSDGDIWASNLNSTVINALSFAHAEARLDGLLRGIVVGQQFLAMGEETIEVWDDAGTIPFPLARSSVISIGLWGPWAVSGFEDGWGGPLLFVAQDGSVRRLDGYTPTRVSNEDLEGLIAQVTDRTELRATVFTHGGNAIWSLSSDSWTWNFNTTTGFWHEVQSYGRPRWRGCISVQAYNQWIVADTLGGRLYAVNAETRGESTDPLVWGMDSGPVKQFPQRIQVPAVYFDFVLGQAVITDDPQVMLSWSRDGGTKWASPITRSIGMQGQVRGRVMLNRCGLTTPAGIRWRFRISDRAYSSFGGARMEATGRR